MCVVWRWQLVDRGPPTSPMMGSPPSVSPPVPYAMLDTYASQQPPPPPKQQSAADSPPAASYKQAAEHKLEGPSVGRSLLTSCSRGPHRHLSQAITITSCICS